MFSAGVYEITSGPIRAKFTAPDHQNKSISFNDTVRVLEGPLKVGICFANLVMIIYESIGVEKMLILSVLDCSVVSAG